MLRQRDTNAVSGVVPANGMDFDLNRNGRLASPPPTNQARRVLFSVLHTGAPAQVRECKDRQQPNPVAVRAASTTAHVRHHVQRLAATASVRLLAGQTGQANLRQSLSAE